MRKATRKASRKKSAKKSAKKASATKARRPSAAKKPGPRADLGAPIDSFFDRQPAHLRAILEALRKLVEKAAPDAESSIKWGMPFYTLNGEMMCMLGAHKSHVNLVLVGPAGTFSDPKGLLTGQSKAGRHLKLTAVDEIPHASVRGWLAAAAKAARSRR